MFGETSAKPSERPADCGATRRETRALFEQMPSTTRTHSTRANLTRAMSRRLLGSLALLALLTAGRARAQNANAARAVPPACDQETSAVRRSTCMLARALAGKADSARIAVAPTPALPSAVAERVARSLAERLGTAAEPSPSALSLAEAEREASSARGLIYVTVGLYRDHLELRADVYTGAGHFWQRLQHPGLQLCAHASATSPLDPELRALFAPIPLTVTRIEKVLNAEREILALACGDARGDGSSELLVVSRRRVLVGSISDNRFRPRASLDWAAVSSVAKSPLREPIAACSIAAPGTLLVGSSDRADALELSATLQVQHKWHGLMPWPGAGCARRAGLGYEGRIEPCPGSTASNGTDFGTIVDAVASRTLADPRGQLHTLRVARPLGSEVARAIDSLQAEVSLPNSGAQLAVSDLDEDGSAEIVTSAPTLDRSADRLVVRTLTENGQLRERFHVPVPTGIDAVAICPSDGRTMAPIVLASGESLWVIR